MQRGRLEALKTANKAQRAEAAAAQDRQPAALAGEHATVPGRLAEHEREAASAGGAAPSKAAQGQ